MKSASNEVRQAINGYNFCADILESPSTDHHLKKTLNHLTSFKTFDQKDITNPYLFRVHPWWPPLFFRPATELKSFGAL